MYVLFSFHETSYILGERKGKKRKGEDRTGQGREKEMGKEKKVKRCTFQFKQCEDHKTYKGF